MKALPLILVMFLVKLGQAPTGPGRFSARVIDAGHVSLAWEATPGAAAYRIYRDGELIGSAGETRHEDKGTAEGKTYLYHVAAVDKNGVESPRAAAMVTTHDRYGASPMVKCSGNPRPVTWTITGVRRSGTATYYYISSPHPTTGPAEGLIRPGMALTATGTTADGGSFNSTAGNWIYVERTYLSSPPYYFTTASRPGSNAVAQTSQGGTLTLATWYLEKIHNEWWFCSPLDNGMKAMGVYKINTDGGLDAWGVQNFSVVNAKYAKGPYGNITGNWMMGVLERLRWWGFNTLDEQHFYYLAPWGQTAAYWPTTPDNCPPIKMAAVTSYPKTTPNVLYNRYGHASDAVKNLARATNPSVFSSTRVVADYFDANFAEWIDKAWDKPGVDAPPGRYQDYLMGLAVDDRDDHPWAAASHEWATVPAGKNSFHAGWITLITSPLQAAANNVGIYVVYQGTRVHTKEALKVMLQSRYSSITELNNAWGASYTQWDSTGTASSAAIGVGDGNATTFSGTLLGTRITPWSIQVLKEQTAVAGDDGAGKMIRRGATPGTSGAVAGTIDYQTGAITITLGEAPAPGEVITVSYVQCGWGCGTGMMDEDGRHNWVPRTGSTTATAGQLLWSVPPSPQQQAGFLQDMDDFLYQYASQYFGTIQKAGRRFYPGVPYLGLSSVGAWMTPARGPVLRAARDYCDVLRLDQIDASVIAATTNDYASRMNYLIDHGGDKPWTWWTGMSGAPDAYFTTQPTSGPYNWPSQAARGEWYRRFVEGRLNQAEADGIIHTAGINFWAYYDTRTDVPPTNWGLVDLLDNAYDGWEPGANGGGCSYPLSNYNCGIIGDGSGTYYWEHACGTSGGKATGPEPVACESQPYGDFISYVRAANVSWYPRPRRRLGGGAVLGGGRIR